MAPPTKKRKEPPKNGTLLDFFSGPPSQRVKIQSSRPQQSTGSANKKLDVKVTSTNQMHSEIIVIDSDSDDDVLEVRNPDARAVTTFPRRTGACQLVPKTKITADSDRPLTFGNPSALLNPAVIPVDPHTHETSSLVLESGTLAHCLPIFGTANSLLQSPSDDSSATLSSDSDSGINACPLEHHERNVTLPKNALAVHTGDSTVVSELDRVVVEWAAGDDELVDMDALDRDINLDLQFDETSARGQTSKEHVICPVCGGHLSDMSDTDIEDHVNKCLDVASNGNTENSKHLEDSTFAVSDKYESTFKESTLSEAAPVQGDRDLYSVLMTSYKENEAWREADVVEDRNFKPSKGSRRKAPFYKVLEGMPIAVDAFRYGTIPGVTAYFLTHAHSDHYTNLAANWKNGPIYCSEDTAKLIMHMLSVDRKWVHPIRMDEPTLIPNTGGVTVTLIEANHCPGSCLFLFEGPQTVHAGDTSFKSPFVGSSRIFRYLHCGDFRASPRHVMHPAVRGKFIDHIYLDTTYLDPKYTFPPQPLVVSACAELARRIVAGELVGPPDASGKRNSTMHSWVNNLASTDCKGQQEATGRILVVVGTYSVGKERIVKAIAQALKTKVYCDTRKAAILRCQNDPELHALLTSDPAEGDVHLLPLGMISSDRLRSYVQRFKGVFSRAVGFRPTGWTYSPPDNDLDPSVQSIISRGQSRSFSFADLRPIQKSTYNIQVFGVPYSEHSSFFELSCFAMSCQWGKMIATVNVGSESSRAKMRKWVERWEAERKRVKESLVQPRQENYW